MKQEIILGYPVSVTTSEETIYWATRQTDRSDTKVIVVVNANKFWLASRDKRLHGYIQRADVVFPEFAVTWAAHKLGYPAIQPVYGVNFTKKYVQYAARHGLRPFFLGGSPQVSENLAAHLCQKYPDLKLAGTHHGFLESPEVEQQALAQINDSQADILFVGMGSPKQEYWIETHLAELQVPVAMGVGGTFDVLSGHKKDTPKWIRGTGTEWIYRLMQNPRHYFVRYMTTNPWLLWQVIKAKASRQ